MNKKKVTKKAIPIIKKKAVDESLNLVRYIIHRFEVNDTTSPSYYIVGFKVVCDVNQRETYVETQIDFNFCNGKSDNEVCSLAYEKLKPKLEDVKADLLKKKFIVGSEFVPPSQ